MEFNVEESDTAASSRERGCLRNIVCFTAIFSAAALIFETLKTYTISQVTALEKQFGLSSIKSGLLVSSNEIGFLIAILFLGHCCRSRHIPRVLAGALVVYGISGICTGLLNFAYPATLPQDAVALDLSNVSTQVGQLCRNTSDSSDDMCLSVNEKAEDFQSSPQMIFILLTVTMIIRGVGKSASYTLGIPFVDNNSRDKPQSSLLTGTITTISFLALSIALYVGGVFSSIPVDLSDTTINPFHPSWIGAWWIGYLVFGGMAVLVAIPVCMFPKHIKKQSAKDGMVKPVSWKEEVKDMHRSMLRVMSNPAVVLLLFGSCSLFFAIGGSSPFRPKYLENQFRVPAYVVNIIFGTQALLWTTGGTLAGSILTSKLKLTNRGCVKMIAIVMGVSTAINSVTLGLGCENQHIKGIGESRFNMTSSALCQCDEEFFPVCGSDSVMYSSPCTAGCRSQNGSTYSDCSEIPGGEAAPGWCERDCPYFIPFVAVEVIVGVAGAISFVPTLITLMKLVEPRDKSMVIALPSFINSLLGENNTVVLYSLQFETNFLSVATRLHFESILQLLIGFLSGPIVYGRVVDSTCSFWQTTCGSVGACALYDLPQLRYRLKGMNLGFQVLSTSGYFLTFLLFKYGIVSDKSPE